MTSDFLITTENRLAAREIKPTKELEKARVRQKLEIERSYCQHQGIDWKLVAENEILKTKACNIQWLYSGGNVHDMILDKQRFYQCKEDFIELYNKGRYSIVVILQYVENEFRSGVESGIAVFKGLFVKIRLPWIWIGKST